MHARLPRDRAALTRLFDETTGLLHYYLAVLRTARQSQSVSSDHPLFPRFQTAWDALTITPAPIVTPLLADCLDLPVRSREEVNPWFQSHRDDAKRREGQLDFAVMEAIVDRLNDLQARIISALDGVPNPPPDDPASKTLELLQNSPAGAALVRYLLEQPDRKASLDDIARHVLGAKNVARGLEAARQRYNRARRALDERDAPLRLVIDAKVISLVVKSSV
jgi:hypothetical protein